MKDEGLSFGQFVIRFVCEIKLDVEIGENLIGMIDEGCSVSDQLMGTPVVVEAYASWDDVEGSVEICGLSGSVERAAWERGFYDEEYVN